MPQRLTHDCSTSIKVTVFTYTIFGSFYFFSPRALTTALLKSGEQMMDACWRHYAATLPRSPTWPSATRTPWSRPGPVTRPSECGAYRPAPRWQSWRDTPPLSPPCRYVGRWSSVVFTQMFVCIWLVLKEDLPRIVLNSCHQQKKKKQLSGTLWKLLPNRLGNFVRLWSQPC